MLKTLSFITFLFVQNSIQDGFQKELNVNIQFPPILDRRNGIPTGHLRPLGWQSRAEGPVPEESVTIEPEYFWDTYVKTRSPVVFRGLVLGADATEYWTDSHLNKNYGHLDIKLDQKKEIFNNEKLQMKLKKFLEGYRLEDWYLNGIMPQEMLTEAPIPRLINCGPFTVSSHADQDEYSKKMKQNVLSLINETDFDLPKLVQLVEPYFWLSAGETSSLIHSHPEHNLHCVLDGRKDFIVIPNDQFIKPKKKQVKPDKKSGDWRKQMGLFESYPNSNEWYSKIDVDKVNVFKYNILEHMVWYYASLRSGDCIYVPSNYLHQVRSHGRSLSSSNYFQTIKLRYNEEKYYDVIKKENFKQCSKNAPLFAPMNLVSKDFLWVYSHSERHLNKLSFTAENTKYFLNYLIKNESLFYENFENFYQEITNEMKNKIATFKPKIRELLSLTPSDLWSKLTTEKSLSVEQIYQIPNSNLEFLSNLFSIVANYHYFESSYLAKSDEL